MTQHTTPYTSPDMPSDSPAWSSFIWLSFAIAISLMIVGIYYLPVDWWIRGYLYMGTLFLTASTLTLSKALRDKHEYERAVSRIRNMRAE